MHAAQLKCPASHTLEEKGQQHAASETAPRVQLQLKEPSSQRRRNKISYMSGILIPEYIKRKESRGKWRSLLQNLIMHFHRNIYVLYVAAFFEVLYCVLEYPNPGSPARSCERDEGGSETDDAS